MQKTEEYDILVTEGPCGDVGKVLTQSGFGTRDDQPLVGCTLGGVFLKDGMEEFPVGVWDFQVQLPLDKAKRAPAVADIIDGNSEAVDVRIMDDWDRAHV